MPPWPPQETSMPLGSRALISAVLAGFLTAVYVTPSIPATAVWWREGWSSHSLQFPNQTGSPDMHSKFDAYCIKGKYIYSVVIYRS